MSSEIPDMVCFSSIELSDPIINGKNVRANVILKKTDGNEFTFSIMLDYREKVKDDYIPILRLAFIMPLLNYGLFSKKLKLHFPISKADYNLIKELNRIFAKDIFVNKILRRRANFILPQYIPNEEHVKVEEANSKAIIEPDKIYDDKLISSEMDHASLIGQ